MRRLHATGRPFSTSQILFDVTPGHKKPEVGICPRQNYVELPYLIALHPMSFIGDETGLEGEVSFANSLPLARPTPIECSRDNQSLPDDYDRLVYVSQPTEEYGSGAPRKQ